VSEPELRWAARTDVGHARERNEDSYLTGERIFAVADGLGGHNAGDVASRLAIEALTALNQRVGDTPDDRIADELSDAVLEANRAVYQRAQADAKVRGMGTTLTAVAIGDGSAHVAHVGDSRCYLLRGESMSQMSSDHTLVARMVAEGKLTPEQAEVHPQRSILTRALGAEPEIDIDTFVIALAPGDRIVLCSDGLSSVVPVEQIRQAVAGGDDLDIACRRLVDAANDRGGPDNITVVLVEVTGTPPERNGGVAAPVVERTARAEPAGQKRARRVPIRAVIWALAVGVVVLGGWIGLRSWVNGSYYVGVSNGSVAIYRGLPTDLGPISLSHVEERTPTQVAAVPEYWKRRLDEGIRADSLKEARAIAARVAAAQGSPGPTPTGSPSPTPTST
jgi:protein phosphatase